MANMKTAATRQTPRNTLQHSHRGTAPHSSPPTTTSWLPTAVATNQPPIIIPLYLGGATFDTNEMPIGDSNSSPKVSTR